jgi:hypothetical protein
MCAGTGDWAVRRGVVLPAPYLDSWRQGGQASPGSEVERWRRRNPTACPAG